MLILDRSSGPSGWGPKTEVGPGSEPTPGEGVGRWGHLEVTGADRVRFLHGLTTINVLALAEGGHAWGAILSPKGRVLSVIELTREAERVLLHLEPALIEPTLALLERYAVMDDVTARAIELVAHQCWTDAGSAWTAPMVLGPAPEPVATAAEAEVARIEAGHLRYGADVDADCFPFETPLAALLDYGKGCYVGQEPVFRVHSQGQSQRTLRGLRFSATTGASAGELAAHELSQGPAPDRRPEAASAGGAERPVAVGATVVHAARPNAGTVTSATVSPRLGAIALAMVHRSAWTPGDQVLVDGRAATVVELPFADARW